VVAGFEGGAVDDLRQQLKRGIAESLTDPEGLETAGAVIDRLCDALDEGVTDPSEIAALAVEQVAGSVATAQAALHAAAAVLRGQA